MRWDFARTGLAAVAMIAAAGCERLSSNPPTTAPAPVSAIAPAPDPALRGGAGQTYPVFVAASGAQYAPDTLGFSAADRARLWRGMATPLAGELLTGGGAEAVVFRGCAADGCVLGVTIVAIDTTSGGVFAAVRDVGGADVLAPNERVEALLRLNSPTRSWDNPAPAPEAAAP